MTIRDYLANPAGKGSSVLGDQSAIKSKYEEEIHDLINSGKGVPNVYVLKKRYLIFHYQLPSKSGAKYGGDLHYDILFQIDTNDKMTYNILDMDFQVYSNCPSFLYTYANLFNKKGLLIDWTKRLYQKETIRKMAEVRNSYGIVGYERSLYITALLIQNSYGNMTCDVLLTMASVVSSTSTIAHMIQSQKESKLSFRNAKDVYAYNQRLAATKEKKHGKGFSNLSTESQDSKTVTKTPKVGKSKLIKKSKKI